VVLIKDVVSISAIMIYNVGIIIVKMNSQSCGREWSQSILNYYSGLQGLRTVNLNQD